MKASIGIFVIVALAVVHGLPVAAPPAGGVASSAPKKDSVAAAPSGAATPTGSSLPYPGPYPGPYPVPPCGEDSEVTSITNLHSSSSGIQFGDNDFHQISKTGIKSVGGNKVTTEDIHTDSASKNLWASDGSMNTDTTTFEESPGRKVITRFNDNSSYSNLNFDSNDYEACVTQVTEEDCEDSD